ncbi:hypothetical protein SUGI_1373370 [Cryptomeria japonica]|uniref:Uncharacterized protein n=1 Tax=Cryptomeria japonica TaxID=3369 RepID=A0AAD3NU50_CRYJA|nr:hypothetical protein SUGI_1373370 [Cryptomeria japonica]
MGNQSQNEKQGAMPRNCTTRAKGLSLSNPTYEVDENCPNYNSSYAGWEILVAVPGCFRKTAAFSGRHVTLSSAFGLLASTRTFGFPFPELRSGGTPHSIHSPAIDKLLPCPTFCMPIRTVA